VVGEARRADRFPLVLGGNCGVALGVVAGLGGDARVVWADAHGDFNTPETTLGGFLDGMGLATLTGGCWTAITATIPGFAAVPDDHVWLLGARSRRGGGRGAGALRGAAGGRCRRGRRAGGAHHT
jgi:arginase